MNRIGIKSFQVVIALGVTSKAVVTVGGSSLARAGLRVLVLTQEVHRLSLCLARGPCQNQTLHLDLFSDGPNHWAKHLTP